MTSVTFAPALRSNDGNSSPARSLGGSRTLSAAIARASSAASPAPLNSAGTSDACNACFWRAHRVAEPAAAISGALPLGPIPSARHRRRKNATALALVKINQSNSSNERMARSRSTVYSGSKKRTRGSTITSAPDSSSLSRTSSDCSGARVTTIRRPASVRDLTVFNSAPREPKQTVRATVQQGGGPRTPQFCTILRGAGAALADRFTAIRGEHARIDPQAASFHAGPHTDGHLAAAFQCHQYGAFGFDRHLRWKMIQFSHRRGKFVLSPARFDANGALSRGGKAYLRRHDLADLLGFSKPVEPGLCQDNGIVIALRELCEPSIHVAAHIHHLEIGAIAPQLRLAAQRTRADTRAARQLIELQPVPRNHGAAHVFSRAACGNIEA